VAALIPWLTGTAFIHSLIVQSKRQLFKRWNFVLIILTFCMVVFGIFLTRSGVLDSVHAFSQSNIGPMFFVFISLTFIASLALLLWRWKLLVSDGQMGSLFSKESAFLFNNLLFILLFLICLAGVLFPLVSEVFTGTKMTVGASWYKQTTGPVLGAAALDGSGAAHSLGEYLGGKTGKAPLAAGVDLPGGSRVDGILERT